jgi:hypothetical protein
MDTGKNLCPSIEDLGFDGQSEACPSYATTLLPLMHPNDNMQLIASSVAMLMDTNSAKGIDV